MSSTLVHSLRLACWLLLVATWVGCAKDEPTVLEPTVQTASLALGGRVLGPDGRNICRTIEAGTMLVRLLNPDLTSDIPFLDEQDITCPDNSFSLSAEAGRAHLRVELPTEQNLDDLPFRHLDQFMVAGDVTHNLRVETGSPLGGRARLDGRPFEGVNLDVSGWEFSSPCPPAHSHSRPTSFSLRCSMAAWSSESLQTTCLPDSTLRP